MEATTAESAAVLSAAADVVRALPDAVKELDQQLLAGLEVAADDAVQLATGATQQVGLLMYSALTLGCWTASQAAVKKHSGIPGNEQCLSTSDD